MELNKTAELIKTIKEWLSCQKHLPQTIENNLIIRFLHCCNYSLERTKYLLNLFYTLRSQCPEIFSNRDPQDENLKQMFQILDIMPLPKPNAKNHKLFIYRLNDSNLERFSYADSLKVFFMIADIRILFDDELTDGEVPIFDMSNVTLRHLTKVSLPLLKKYMVYTQEAHPVNLKEIHVMNVTPFLDRCMAIVKPFMNSEVAKVLHFHQPNSKTIFNYISEDLLPEDYGGKLPKVEELKKEWLEKLNIYRDVFLDENRWKVDENARIRKDVSYGIEGSFRSLNID